MPQSVVRPPARTLLPNLVPTFFYRAPSTPSDCLPEVPHAPRSAVLKCEIVTVPDAAAVACLPRGPHANEVNLNRLSANYLTCLNRPQLNETVQALTHVPVQLLWRDAKGAPCSGAHHFGVRASAWESTNGAAALSVAVGAAGHQRLFSQMLAAAPDAVLPILHHNAGALLTPAAVSDALCALVLQLGDGGGDGVKESERVSCAITKVVEHCLNYWHNHGHTHLPKVIELLAQQVGAAAKRGAKGQQTYTAQQSGVLFGALIAGIMQYSTQRKVKYEERVLIIGAIVTIVWAASSFAPTPTIAGAIAVGAVAVGLFFGFIDIPRDYLPLAKQIQGRIRAAVWLEAPKIDAAATLEVRTAVLEERSQISEMLGWMDIAIDANGLTS